MTTIPHKIIRASAGTGKTFALSDRIVRLLALGAAPESVVALTFTRKAAAEFVAAVFRKLAGAALDEETAHKLAERLKLGKRSAGDFSATLASVVAAMSRLQFGTLDSFFQRAASAIPFELGLSGPIQILDTTAAEEARVHALENLLHEGVDDSQRRALLDAFRAATWGAEEKQLFPRLLGFIAAGHDLFLEAPEPALWGVERTIWPDKNRWLPPPEDIAEDIAVVLEFAEGADKRFGGALRKFAAQAATWQPGMDLPDGTVATQLFTLLSGDDANGSLELTYYNKPCVISEKCSAHFQRIVRHCLGASLAQALRAAQGMRHLIAGYDHHYENAIRRTGRLAFADVTELLRRVEPFLWQPRLDSRLSHWLFDEFQDTSVAQWAVLANLVAEALQDPTGERSVFFVGDPKQAIYRWRGGEHRLMGRIASDYKGAIDVEPLDKSFRSARAVIDFVNRFGTAALNCAGRLPAAAVKEWEAGWSPHATAVTAGDGCVRIREAGEKEELYDALLEALIEVDPIRRGLTCAILTRGNDEAAEIAHALRERGFFDIAAETDVSIMADQPMTQALLALISAAAHPDDKASRGIVEMSPVSHWLAASGGWNGARKAVLDGLAIHGCEATLRGILSSVPDGYPEGRFGRLRIEQLFDIARKYDAGDSRGPDEFVRRAHETIRRETASAGRVQVMTIHKAKGLGFDFVLLPMRANRRMDAVESDPLLVARNDGQAVEWILGRPPATVIEVDAALSNAQEKRRADAAYESLCVLYVALTRARFGLYLFVGPASTNDSTLAAADLVRRAIPGGEVPWQDGDERWFEKPLREPEPQAATPVRAEWKNLPPARQMTAMLPSQSGGGRTGSTKAAEFGAAVHEAFAAIEWDDAMDKGPGESEARKIVESCLAEPEIAALFMRLDANARVWRERAFDVVLDGRWVSGVFDRVILRGDEATLVEFKTDRGSIEEACERHASQIELYRAALAKLTGARKIRAVLVHTASRAAVEI
ncbi:MAG: UvrD-helicase domain-containing protein [Chthoniobacterales bacterium]